MNFLAPLFLLSGLAVALPIFFHLIRRTTRRKIPFSSLMFLQPTPPKITRKSRIEHWLLLLMRCLAMLLIAAAFARPFIKKEETVAVQAGDFQRLVILLDVSASMQRENLWDRASRLALERAEDAAPNDIVALAVFDNRLHRLIDFEQWESEDPAARAALVQSALEEWKPTWSGTDLGAALAASADMIEEHELLTTEESLAGGKSVYLLSDLQAGSRLEAMQSFDWPADIFVEVEALKAGDSNNAGIQPLHSSDSADEAGGAASARALITNNADSEKDQFEVSWAGAGPGQALSVYVPAGQSRVIQVPDRADAGEASALVLKGDGHAFDNQCYLAPMQAQRIRILYLGADHEGTEAKNLYFLRRAFQDTPRYQFELAAHSPDASLSLGELSDFHLIILSDAPVEAAPIKTLLNQGKPVWVLAGNSGAVNALETLAGAEGLDLGENEGNRYALLGDIDFMHPVMSVFADMRYSDFTKIQFWKYRRINDSALPGAEIICRFDNGDPALFTVPAGAGRVIALAGGLSPKDTALARSSKFVPLIFSMMEYSGLIRLQPRIFEVGRPIPLESVFGRLPQESVTISRPDSSSDTMPGDRLEYTRADTPGIYEFAAGQRRQKVAVNLPPLETRTTPLETDDLEAAGLVLEGPGKAAVLTPEKKVLMENSKLEQRQKLWRKLLAAALILLLLESAFATWWSRRALAAA